MQQKKQRMGMDRLNRRRKCINPINHLINPPLNSAAQTRPIPAHVAVAKANPVHSPQQPHRRRLRRTAHTRPQTNNGIESQEEETNRQGQQRSTSTNVSLVT
jgi:hypothetical protein